MKKALTLFAFLSCFISISAQTALRVGVAGLAVIDMDYKEGWIHGGPSFAIEHGFKQHFSFNLEFLYGKSPATAYGGTTTAYKRQILLLRPELRYYFKQSMKGAYAGVHLIAALEPWEDVQNEKNSDFGGYLGPGATFGTCVPLGKYLDLNFGLNCAVNIGEFFLLPGAVVQIGCRL